MNYEEIVDTDLEQKPVDNQNPAPKQDSLLRDTDPSELEGQDYDTFIKTYARKRKVPSKLIKSLLNFESSDRDDATSKAGAEGRAQMMPNTAKRLGIDPRNKWQAAIGAIHYLEDEYKALRPLAIDDLHGIHAAIAAYLGGRKRVSDALKQGRYLPDREDERDKYTKLPIARYVENIVNGAGGNDTLFDEEDDVEAAQPVQTAPSALIEPETASDEVPTTTAYTQNPRGETVASENVGGDTRPRDAKQERALVAAQFGENSPELKEYDKTMSKIPVVKQESLKLLADTEKGLVRDEKDEANRLAAEQQAKIKQNQSELDEAEQAAFSQYRLTGRREDYDNTLKGTLVGSYTIQIQPGDDGTSKFIVDGKPAENNESASEQVIRQLARQFTRDSAAIEKLVTDYKLRGGGRIRLFDADSGKSLDEGKELRNYTIKLPADVALQLKRAEKALGVKEDQQAEERLNEALSLGDLETNALFRTLTTSPLSWGLKAVGATELENLIPKGSALNAGGLAKALSFNGVANQVVGGIASIFDDDLGKNIKQLGLNPETGQYYSHSPEELGFKPGTKAYEVASNKMFAAELSGTVVGEVIKLLAVNGVLSKVGNVVAKGSQGVLSRVLPKAVRLSQNGEITAASGSVIGTEAFTSAVQLSETALQSTKLISQLIGSTTAFAGLQTIAPQGWVVRTDVMGKFLGLDRAIVESNGKLRKETLGDLAQNFGKHWLTMAAFAGIDVAATGAVSMVVNNDATKRFLTATLVGTGKSMDEALALVENTITPATIKILGNAASSFAFTAASNPEAVKGILGGKNRSLLDFAGDYLMNAATMAAMHGSHAGLQIKHPDTGKIYELGKGRDGAYLREVTGSKVGVNVAEPTNKLELDFLVKNYVDHNGSTAQKAVVQEAYDKTYLAPETEQVTKPAPVAVPRAQEQEEDAPNVHDEEALSQMRPRTPDGGEVDEMYAEEKRRNGKPSIEFPEVGDFPTQENARKQEIPSEKVPTISDSSADSNPKVTEAYKEVAPTKTRQTADPIADVPQEKQGKITKANQRSFKGEVYDLTPEQIPAWDQAAKERDDAIRAAIEAPNEARLEERTDAKGAKYNRWVDNKTNEEIPNGVPAPDALRRSLAKRQAELEFTRKINQITGKQSDGLSTVPTAEPSTPGAAGAARTGTRSGDAGDSGFSEQTPTNRTEDPGVRGAGEPAGRATGTDAVTRNGKAADAATETTSAPTRVKLGGRELEITTRTIEENGVVKVQVRDARGNRFYVDKDLVDEAINRPLNRVETILSESSDKISRSVKVKDTVRKAITDFQIAYESYDAVTGKGFVQSGDAYIFYSTERAAELSDASVRAFVEGTLDGVISVRNAGAVTLSVGAAHALGKHVSGDLGAVLRSAQKPLALLNYDSADRATNFAHETTHLLTSVLPISKGSLEALGESAEFKSLREELSRGSQYSKVSDYELAQEVLAFAVTGDAKTFGRNLSSETLKKAAKKVFSALKESNPDLPLGQLKKLALGVGREVVKDFTAATKTAKSLGSRPDYHFMLRRAEELAELPQEVFDDAKKLSRQEFIEKYRGAYSYSVRKSVLDYVGQDGVVKESLNPRAADDKRAWSLDHYSREQRSRIEPEFAGTANAGRETRREDRVQVSYYYTAGTTPEPIFRNYKKHSVTEDLNIYDLSADKLNLREKFSGDASKIERYLKENQFDGYWSPEADADSTFRNIVAVFKPLDVKAAESPLYRKDKTDTEEFKRWFGESKVVDRKGNPLTVYHGTRGDFEVFNTQPTEKEPGSHFGTAKAAEYFTKNYKKEYWDSSNIMPVHLSIKNPVEVLDVFGNMPIKLSNELVRVGVLTEAEAESVLGTKFPVSKEETKSAYEGIVSLLKSKGYDGFKYKNFSEDSGSTSWVAFDPAQIKSQFNKGSFDPENNNILYRKPTEDEAVSALRNGDYVILSGNQSIKQGAKDVKRTASLKAELERKGFEVFSAEGNYLGTKEDALFVPIKDAKERDLLNAIAGAYKQKQIFSAKSGRFTAPFSDGTERESYSPTNSILFGSEALKQDGYTKVKLGDSEIIFSVPDLYSKERTAKHTTTEKNLRAAIENQDKFFAKKALSWNLMDRAKRGLFKANSVAEAVRELERHYMSVFPTTSEKPSISEQTARYVSDNVHTVKEILRKGLYEKDWYDDDMQRMFSYMEENFPGIETNKAAQQAFGILLATTSSRMSVANNYSTAAKIFTRFLKTLKVPRHQEKLNNKGQPAEYGIFGDALGSTNKLFQGYVFNPTGEMKFSPAFKKEIDFRGMQAVMDYLASPSIGSLKDREYISQELYGMKIGSFLLNLNGNAYIPTIDSWMLRSWNIINGNSTKIGKNKETGKPELQTIDTPNDSKADIIRGAIQAITKKLNQEGYEITPVEVQALIWTHHKELVNKVMKSSDDSSYGLVSKKIMQNPELSGTFDKFSKKFGEEAGTVSRELGKDVYLRKPEVTSRVFFRKEGEDVSGRDDYRDKLFYSQLSRVVEAKLPEKFSKDQLVGLVENPVHGVKKDELIWSGFTELLKKDQKSFTRQEVLDFLNENRVKIYEKQSQLPNPDYSRTEEERLSRLFKFAVTERDSIVDEIKSEMRDWRAGMSPEQFSDTMELYRVIRQYADNEISFRGFNEALEDRELSLYDVPDSLANILPNLQEATNKVLKASADYNNYTKGEFTGDFETTYSHYTTAAGKDYRELIIKADGIDTASKHYLGEDHIIASARFKTLNQDGKKVLMVEEIQSDHHQEGRKKGYKDESISPQEREKIYRAALNELEELDALGFDTPREALSAIKVDAEWSNNYDVPKGSGEAVQKYIEMFKSEAINNEKVNDAPFKKNWHEVTFRRLMKYAADNGYDSIAWTSGNVQAERYSLDKHFEEIRYNKAQGKLEYKVKGSRNIETTYETVTPERLPEFVGEGIAQKLLAFPSEDNPNFTNPQISKVKTYDGSYVEVHSYNNAKKTASINKEEDGSAIAYYGDSKKSFETFDSALEWLKSKESTSVKLVGDDLVFTEGGDGMRGFYDKILVSYANKLGKQLGSKVEPFEVEGKELIGSNSRYKLTNQKTGEVKEYDSEEGALKAAEVLDDYDWRIDRIPTKEQHSYHSMNVTPQFAEKRPLFRKEDFLKESVEKNSVYHTTFAKENFDTFDPVGKTDFGIHVGSLGASESVVDKGGGNRRTLKLSISLKNPIDMEEPRDGHWDIDYIFDYLKNEDAYSVSSVSTKLGKEKYSQFISELGEIVKTYTPSRDLKNTETIPLPTKDKISARQKFIDVLSSYGFDGIRYENQYEDEGSVSYILLSPNQLKSDIGNNGAYDLNNSSMLFRKNTYQQSEEDWLNLAARNKNQPLNETEIRLIREAYQTGASELQLFEIADRMKVSVPRFLIKMYKANLLSGASTTVANTMSNIAMQVGEEAARLPASLLDYVNSKLTGQPRTVQGISPRGIAEGLRGLKIGAKEFIEDVRTENPNSPYAIYSKSGINALDNTVGRLGDLVIRFVGGQDKIFAGYATKRAAYEAAALRAKNEGISIEKALQNPTLEDSDMALRYGLYSTFNEENQLVEHYNSIRKTVYEHAAPLGWFLDTKVPFVRTGTNIFFTTMDYLGVNGTLRGLHATAQTVDRKSWEQTKKNFSEEWSKPEVRREAAQLFGRGATGLGIAYLFFQAAAAGLVKINSFYDDDDYTDMNKRANENSNPMSIKIGDTWYGFGRLSPIGQLAAAGATMHAMSKGDSESGAEFAKELVATAPLGKAMSEATKPKLDKDKPWYAYLVPEMQSMVPGSGMLRDIASTGDVRRQTKVKGDYWETQKNKVKEIIPGMRPTLDEKTSSLGYTQDVPNSFKGFSTEARTTQLLTELEKLDWYPEAFDSSTKKEFTQRQKLERRQALEKVVKSPEYQAMKTVAEKKYALQTALRSLGNKEEKSAKSKTPEKQQEKVTRKLVKGAVKKILGGKTGEGEDEE